jgi:Bacterial aa3 type cytochrome c oxidase subunit IV
MADDHSVATAEDDADLPAHEETYAEFLSLVEVTVTSLFCILLLLVLWGLEGHGGIAFIGFVLTAGAAFFGLISGMTWRAVLPVFVLLGLACIVL